MTLWNVVILLAVIGGGVGVSFNIRSLIRKWKANPGKWADLLPGIVISIGVIVFLVVMFIRYLP